MNNNKFEELKKEFGERLVFVDEKGIYCFMMGDGLLDMDDEESKEYDRLEELLYEGKVDGIIWWLGYGDDVINCVSLESLELFDKVEGLEKFVVKYIGENCYMDE